MRRSQWSLMCAVIATWATCGVAGAQTSTLAGTNVLTVDGSGYALVYLPVEVKASGQRGQPGDPRFLIETTADHFAVAELRRASAEDPGAAVLSPAIYGWVVPGKRPDNYAPQKTLPAGWYDLLVFADGGQTRVRLDVPGLSGTQEVRADRSIALVAQGVDSSESQIAPSTIRVGVAQTLRRRGFMFADSRYQGADTSIAHLEYCAYDHATASVDPGDSYDVGCPGGSTIAPIPPYPEDLSGYAMYFDIYPGAWSVGGNLAFSGTAPRWSVFMASVEFPLDQVPDQPPSLAPPNSLGSVAPVTSSSSTRGSLVVGRPRLRGTSALVPIRCVGSGPCTGMLRLRPGTRSARVRLVAGARASVRIPVARRLLARVRGHGSARAVLVIVESEGTPLLRQRTRPVLLRGAPHRARHSER